MSEGLKPCIFKCEECSYIFDHDVRKDNDRKWGHICKAKNYQQEHRCESYLDKYILDNTTSPEPRQDWNEEAMLDIVLPIMSDYFPDFRAVRICAIRFIQALIQHFKPPGKVVWPKKMECLSNPPLHDFEDGEIQGRNDTIDEFKRLNPDMGKGKE